MMTERPDEFFFDVLVDDLGPHLVETLSTAYDELFEWHAPKAVGDNTATFFYRLYHSLRKRFTALGDQLDYLELRGEGRAFRLKVGEYTIGFYNVGKELLPIHEAFPDNDVGAPAMVEPYLPGLEPRLSNLRKVILTHMGNPEHGLLAAHLCLPVDTENHRISMWGWAEELWVTDTSVSASPIESVVPTAAEEEIDEPLVVRKTDNQSDVDR